MSSEKESIKYFVNLVAKCTQAIDQRGHFFPEQETFDVLFSPGLSDFGVALGLWLL